MSSYGCFQTFREIIVTDPSYIKTRTDFDENITVDQQADRKYQTPSNYVKIPITTELYQHLKQKKLSSPPQASYVDAEEMFVLISPDSDSQISQKIDTSSASNWKYLGSHTSDSGLTCILDANPYLDSSTEDAMPPEDLELDWLELVTMSLEGGPVDLEVFPLLHFCVGVPEGESAVAVYGQVTNTDNEPLYKSLVLRAWNRAFPHNDNSSSDDDVEL